jgi:hypothetical protein
LDRPLDLLKFCHNPGVVHVIVGVKFRQRLERLLVSVVIHEPAGRLWEQEYQGS